ncbi:hypothetical protein NBCG_05455 [Nocardioidaceae bacterium Broad-1]|uniref:hypothetical protein n=1 Tax=Nocardioides luteus TaxID=1844 RepID=UPI0002029182|nr:hypothetical protein [Nocardioides luteus]EGD40283.1 hypothetical protein NBCG_05455 [Nocardioidaceae bacterium Broad-1]MBG6095414.1 uncharacterized protein YceK [Nocardioides luteus]
MRTATTWRGVRTFAPVVLLGTVAGLALQGCMSVEVRVDPAQTAPAEPAAYYGVVEHTSEDCWRADAPAA